MDTSQIEAWLKTDGVKTGIDIILACLVVLLGVVVARIAKRSLNAAMERTRIKDDLLLRSFFLRVMSVAIMCVALLVALRVLEFDVTSFVAGLGITGIILGFGFKDMLSNLAAGLLLLIYRPFMSGDMIEVEGAHGRVEELTIVNTQLISTDGVRVIMPNSRVWGAKIVNYSRSKERRLEFVLKVRDDDVAEAIAVVQKVLDEDDRILKTPTPDVRVTSMANSCATLTIWAWTDPENFMSVGGSAYLRLQSALEQAEVTIQ
ncbi:MAG TPA: mechanosensitive ion channel family protein [Blastocatellia bacterium]|nr:mechanosensitive ion channel family protein [Blastocatellia bacterium]